MKQNSFSVIGGDERSLAAISQLCQQGQTVLTFGINAEHLPAAATAAATLREAVTQSRYILLPLPVTQNHTTVFAPLCDYSVSIQDLLQLTSHDQLLFGGRFTELLRQKLSERSVPFLDYTKRPDFAVANAVPTAEAAIEIAIRETPFTLNQTQCLITGYGRIAKILAHMLHGLGACVSVAARRYDDLNSIAAHGYKAIAIESLTDTLPSFRVIFNTVPALLFNKTALERTQTDVLLIDLASAPGGIDFDAAEQLKRKSIQALGLPGKSAPETAGKIICDTVLNYLHETEVIE